MWVECQDRMLAPGQTHFDRLVRGYLTHFNSERPKQALGNRPLPEAGEPEPTVLRFPQAGVVCEHRLGGLYKHDRRAA